MKTCTPSIELEYLIKLSLAECVYVCVCVCVCVCVIPVFKQNSLNNEIFCNPNSKHTCVKVGL